MTPAELKYINELISNCETAKGAKCIGDQVLNGSSKSEFDLSELTCLGPAVYVIEQIGGNPQATFEALKTFKGTGQRACPQLHRPSRTLYVGSSARKLSDRLKLHICENGSKKTSALHMRYWFTGKFRVRVDYFDVAPKVLQILEDARSTALQPAFGKLGGNNKA